jgi:hypothetical protein
MTPVQEFTRQPIAGWHLHSPDSKPVCFLMSRSSGFGDSEALRLRSGTFERMLLEHQRLTSQEQTETQDLVELLHTAVSECQTPAGRRVLIELKRDVFNGRIAVVPNEALDSGLAKRVENLIALRGTLATLWANSEERIVSELEDAAAKLLDDPRLTLALAYAAPGLQERLRHRTPRMTLRLKSLNALYSYCQKATTKAPALHMFGQLSLLPGGPAPVLQESYEIVCRSSFLVEVEKTLVRSAAAGPYLRIQVLPSLQTATQDFFLSVTRTGMNWISIPRSPMFDSVMRILEGCCGQGIEECISTLSSELGAGVESTRSWLQELASAGIVSFFLASGPMLNMPAALADRMEQHPRLKLLNMHGSMIAADDFYALCRNNPQVASAMQKDAFVYRYRPIADPELVPMADRFGKDLRMLGRTLTQIPAFQGLRHSVRSAWLKALPERHSSMGLLEWIRIAAKDHPDVTANHREPAVSLPPLSQMTGQLDLRKLGDLAGPTGEDLCVLGAVDPTGPMFYPHNFYHGSSRYLAKYRIGVHRTATLSPGNDPDTIDVELVGPIEAPHNLVRPTLSWGFSFESRHRERFAHWLEASDVEVRRHNETWRFVQRSTGRQVRFVYYGLSIFRDLPAPYQALLTGQPDTYDNPFDRMPIRFQGKPAMFVEGLYYESICLRRPCWLISAAVLSELLLEPGFTASAANAASRIRSLTGIEGELYFRLHNGETIFDRPHRIDLSTPLGWFFLKRYLSRFTQTPHVHITLPAPERRRHPQIDREPVFTELMVRVGGGN